MTQPDHSTASNSDIDATVENSPRLAQFQAEVDELGVSGGQANSERRVMRVGILVQVIGLILVIAAYLVSDSSVNYQDQIDMVILALLGIGLMLVGGIFIAINAVTRFLRYWLVRLIYELRQQTDSLK